MSYKKYRELIKICSCGHGKVHHNGKYAECTCPVEVKKYTYNSCNCPNFKMNLDDYRNKKIMEWNRETENQNTVEVNGS